MGYKSLTYLKGIDNVVVIDNSVIMRWILNDGSVEEQQISRFVLKAISTHDITPVVPFLWIYEASNVITSYVKKGLINIEVGQKRLGMPFDICHILDHKIDLSVLVDVSVKYNLSSYDASYLSLANILQCPISTLDKKLQRASLKFGRELYAL